MPFKPLLNRLLEEIPGAVGAIITDWEGEAVDQVARISEYEIKVLGAHKGVILNLLREALSRVDSGDLEEVLIRTEQSKTLIAPLNREYFLVLSLSPEVIAARAAHKMHRCVAELRSEFE